MLTAAAYIIHKFCVSTLRPVLRKNNSKVSIVLFERKEKVGPRRAEGLLEPQPPTLYVSLVFEFIFTM